MLEVIERSVNRATSEQRWEDRNVVLDARTAILERAGKVLDELERTSLWNFPKRGRLWKEHDRLMEQYEGAKQAYDVLARSHGIE